MYGLKFKRIVFLLLLLPLCLSLYAQEKGNLTIAGIVYDETGEPTPGVTVYLKDRAGMGTITDIDGKFSLKVTKGDIIVFSFVGYEKIEHLALEENKNLVIRLKENAAQLDEVVVVGMGSQRKISSVAAISSVNVKDLQTPTTSVSNLLGGRVAGVISTMTSGEPGQNISEFWVRGIGTFGASSGALVLIDGLEGDINSIDPADIESFSVLKDASATAVYGVRGANGVVLVTTKRGESGKMNITARANFTVSHLNRMPEYLRAYDYAKLANEARVLRGENPEYDYIETELIRDHMDPDIYPDVNWQEEIMNRTSIRQSYYVSANGGGEVSRYFISLGGSMEDAAYKQDRSSVYSSNVGYGTYTYRMNLDINLTPTTRVYFGSDGFLSMRNEPGADTNGLWDAQAAVNPLRFPTVYSNGKYPAASSSGEGVYVSPYVAINHMGKTTKEEYKGKATMSLSQDFSQFVDGLKFRMQGAYDIHSYFNESRLIVPSLYLAAGKNLRNELVLTEIVQQQAAYYEKEVNQYRKYHFEGTLNYDRVFNRDHRVSGLLYYYLSDQKKTADAKRTGTTSASLNAIPVRYQGVSSRFTYGFRDTYMADVNFGYTGSENFQPGRQYGFFPSFALGWVPTGYEWLKERLPWLDFFKIRASYGVVGNDRLLSTTTSESTSRFPYLTKVTLGVANPYGGALVEAINESVIGADNLEWERAIKTDLGVEGWLLGNRLNFVVDIFNDQRDGIFQLREQVPEYVGLINPPYGNVGRMRSYGSDGNISYTQELGKRMSFTVRGNYTYSQNKIQNWEESFREYPYLERSGWPNETLRGYQAIGLFKDEADVKYSPKQPWGEVLPGDIKYKDVNGDGKIDETDKVPLSYNTFPTLMYGFGGEFRYRNFTLGALFKGTGKTDFFYVGQSVRRRKTESYYNNGMGYVPFFQGVNGNVLTIVNDPANRWIPLDYAIANGIDPALAENPDARFPRLQYGNNSNNSQLSTFWQGDSRYLRLQEITLNYNLKHDFLRRIGISSIDIQFIGANLYVWDRVKIFDPEQAQFAGMVYPIPSTYTLQLYIRL
ncbi:MAG: TonB-dependent receptor [Tannerella sp.]|jgi:TonB-linked SusC/RagA family outer membrane protein|nr:TonB-dependent receptor [Tannerella sp.]